MRFCDVSMFWSESGGGVRRYLEMKRSWLARTRPEDDHLLVIPGAGSGMLTDGGHWVARVPSMGIPFAPGYRIPVLKTGTVRVLDRWNPSLIECGSPFVMRRAVSLFRSRTGTPVFDYYHAYFPRNYTAAVCPRRPGLRRLLEACGWSWLRRAYRDSTRVFVASPTVAEDLRRHGITNTEQAPLGVDLELFRVKRLGEESEAPSMLFAGRLTEEKGLSAVLDCYLELRRRRAGVSLTVVGDGLLRGRIEALAARDPGVRFRGFLSQPELAAAYREAWLLLSAAPAETLGLCFLEALASGTPVVGLSGSGLMDTFPTEVSRAVGPGGGGPLADAVLDVIGSRPAPSACRSVAEGYGWEAGLSRILSREIELARRAR